MCVCVCIYICIYIYRPLSKLHRTFFFWLSHEACGILVPWPGIEPGPPAVEAQSPNHWTSREFPLSTFWKHLLSLLCAVIMFNIIQMEILKHLEFNLFLTAHKKSKRKPRREPVVHRKLSHYVEWGLFNAHKVSLLSCNKDTSKWIRPTERIELPPLNLFLSQVPCSFSVNSFSQVLKSETREIFFPHLNLVLLFI